MVSAYSGYRFHKPPQPKGGSIAQESLVTKLVTE